MNAPAVQPHNPTALTPATAQIGAQLEGGILVGRFFLEARAFALIAAPKHEGEIPVTVWHKSHQRIEGALSDWDGLANTSAMAEDGNALAVKTMALQIGELSGWYLPSRGELLLAWSARAALPEAERFEEDVYWSSTQSARFGDYAWFQSFNDGTQNDWRKDYKDMARAVRRVSI